MRTTGVLLTIALSLWLCYVLADHPTWAGTLILCLWVHTGFYVVQSIKIDQRFYEKYPEDRPPFWPFP